MNCNYKVKITDIQTKYKFKVFCTGYDDSEIKEKIDAMYQAWPKATAEGETPTLDNTANATMSIDLKGNTSQDGTPTPDDPKPIKVVTGDNEIKIIGKNIFNLNDTHYTRYTTSYTIRIEQNSVYVKNSRGDGNGFVWWNIPVTTGKSITISYGDIEEATVYENNKMQYKFSEEAITSYSSDLSASLLSISKTDKKITAEATNKYLILCLRTSNSGEYTISNIQVEYNDTQTSYKSYQSKSYPINLGDIELCKIGDYQDYLFKENGKWYKHKEVGKQTFIGNDEESWASQTTNTAGYSRFRTTSLASLIRHTTSSSDIFEAYSNIFLSKSGNDTFALVNGIGCIASGNIFVYYDATKEYTLNEFKNWLSINNLILYYQLATPINEEITDATLISQLNALVGAESYSGQTNISQTNDDKPFIITAKALIDLSNL